MIVLDWDRVQQNKDEKKITMKNDDRLVGVVSSFVISGKGRKDLNIEEMVRYVIAFRNSEIAKSLSIGILLFLVAGSTCNNFDWEFLTQACWCSCAICFLAYAYFIVHRGSIFCDNIPEEYRAVVVDIVEHMFSFLFRFGHWPENILDVEKLMSRIGKKLDQIDEKWPGGFNNRRNLIARDRILKSSSRFFHDKIPNRPSARRFDHTVLSV